jgi:hypothetical protein
MNHFIPLVNDHQDEKSSKGRNRFGMTGHEATQQAAELEDTARADCLKATAAVRTAQTEIARRKSQLQVSVNRSRELVMAARRAAKTGNFGSSAERHTDPATRKMHRNPEDPKTAE